MDDMADPDDVPPHSVEVCLRAGGLHTRLSAARYAPATLLARVPMPEGARVYYVTVVGQSDEVTQAFWRRWRDAPSGFNNLVICDGHVAAAYLSP